jgi:hypothetical protein
MRYQFIESTVVGGCIVIALELLLHPEKASVKRNIEKIAPSYGHGKGPSAFHNLRRLDGPAHRGGECIIVHGVM